MSKFNKIIVVLFSSFFLSLAVNSTEVKFGHVGKPGSLFSASVDHFAKLANERLGSKGKVSVFGSSQLGKDKQGMQKLKLGTVDMWLPSSVMASIHDEFGVFDMPFIIKDRKHMNKVESQVLPGMFKNLEAKTGYQVIAVWENGFRHITNNVRAIDKPDDLKGIKLRTPKSKWRVKMFQSYGAPYDWNILTLHFDLGVLNLIPFKSSGLSIALTLFVICLKPFSHTAITW